MKHNHSALLTLLLIAAMLCTATKVHAVFEESDLPHTLGILKLELKHKYEKQKEFMERNKSMGAAQHATLIEYLQRSEQISLILYSQNSEFTFDVAYACQQATELYHGLNTKIKPFDKIRERIVADIERYDSLICALKRLPPPLKDKNSRFTEEDSLTTNLVSDTTVIQQTKSSDTKKDDYNDYKSLFVLSNIDIRDRAECIAYAEALRKQLIAFLESLNEDVEHYEVVKKKVTALNDYAQEKYKDLQSSIFSNNQTNYFEVLFNIKRHWMRAQRDIDEKYVQLSNDPDRRNHSQWRGPVVLGVSVFMLAFILLATILSNLIMRWIPSLVTWIFPHFGHKVAHMRHRIIPEEDYKKKRFVIILALGILIFTISLGIVDSRARLNIVHMANNLMMNFSWLIEVILISLLIRLSASQIREGVKNYMPFLWMALIVIFFRIILIPNTLITIICPPILLILTIWQLNIFRKRTRLPLSDSILSSISLVVMLTSCVFSWFGSNLLAVQIIIWWTFQLACVETIILCSDLLQQFADNYVIRQVIGHFRSFHKRKEMLANNAGTTIRKMMKSGEFINKTWFYDLCRKAILPMAAVASIPLSIYWAADIFEMKETFLKFFMTTFNISSFIGAFSMFKLCLGAALFFLFNFFSYLFNSIYIRIRRQHEHTLIGKASNETLAKNIIGIIVWGVYTIGMLGMLQVPWEGITIVFTGLATGMGFAMKDLLENFFYGISLMSGRVRVGDYIECDGIRGQVESISYQSTQIITEDGSVMAFLNSALFSKNFKNLTKNNRYEFTPIPVGVAYGTNVNEIRKYIIDAIKPLYGKTEDGRDLIDTKHPVSVRFSGFGDNSIDLNVIVWALVDKRPHMIGLIKEAIYNTLNEHNVEIPYPQRDIYIKNYEK